MPCLISRSEQAAFALGGRLALFAMLSFTLPAHESAPGCLDALAPLADLDSLYVHRIGAGVVVRQGVAGCEGWAWAVPVTVPGVYYVTTRDRAGNESCASPMVNVGGALDVPDSPPTATAARWFDIAGRRVTGPLPQGVYLRRGKRRVVLR